MAEFDSVSKSLLSTHPQGFLKEIMTEFPLRL